MASIQFTVNPTNIQAYKKVEFYITNNLYYTLIKNDDLVDEHFKLIELSLIHI